MYRFSILNFYPSFLIGTAVSRWTVSSVGDPAALLRAAHTARIISGTAPAETSL